MAHPASFNQDDLKQRILKYHVMLSVGCGRSDCTNPNCASCPAFEPLSRKEVLKRAIELVQHDAPLCLDPAGKKARGAAAAADVVPHGDDANDPTGLIALLSTGDLDLIDQRMRLVFIDSRSVCAYFGTPRAALKARAALDALADDAAAAEKLYDHLGAAAERIHVEFSSSGAKDAAVLAAYVLVQSKLFLDPMSHPILRQLLAGLSEVDAPDRARLVGWLSETDAETISHIVNVLQTYISVRWVTSQNVAEVAAAVQFLGVLYDANEALDQPLDYTEFHNEVINSEFDLRSDYERFHQASAFCFSRYAYILDAASKSNLLQFDASLQMRDQYDEAVMRFIFQNSMAGPSPFLVLQVHRDNIVEDTLVQLQGKNSDDFKKPLKVKFIGEDGVDEGGIQKEFFQLLMRQLFNPAYGMFFIDDESEYFWFNKDSLESELEFELIGIMLGLAIYNSVILDIRFPIAVYKKLLGQSLKFRDFRAFSPSLHKGLVQLLEFDGDVESVFARTFSIEYNFFGETKTVELCPGGSQISLTSANRDEYVDLFVDYTFNKSIETQFKAFQNGFELVCGGPWLRLFRAEELDLSICGSPVLDFNALESAARYENYSNESPVIVNFWKVVHQMTDDQKRKFLQFCTGSDRVPINGLGSLKVPFVVARNGSDSDRLPTSHTCFNHLLLPDYSTLDKLRERLLTAIQNSEGFGLM